MKQTGGMTILDPMDYMILARLVWRPLMKRNLLDFFALMRSYRETEEDTGVLAPHMLEPRIDALIRGGLIRTSSEIEDARLCVTTLGIKRLRRSQLVAFWHDHATTGELARTTDDDLFMGPDVHGSPSHAGTTTTRATGMTEDGSPTSL